MRPPKSHCGYSIVVGLEIFELGCLQRNTEVGCQCKTWLRLISIPFLHMNGRIDPIHAMSSSSSNVPR